MLKRPKTLICAFGCFRDLRCAKRRRSAHSFSNQVGARPDEHSLPLSERLERFLTALQTVCLAK